MEFFKANIHLGEVFVQLIAFIIVFLTLKGMAWKPILRGMELRRARIQQEFESIESAKKGLESMKAEYTALLQKIEDEARAKIQEAVNDGRRISKELQDKARAESQVVFEKAKENLELEIAKARIALLSTSGISCPPDPPFDMDTERANPMWGDPSWRRIPATATAAGVEVNHLHIDTSYAKRDLNVALPVDRLRELVAAGEVGSIAPTHYSVMRFQLDAAQQLAESAPAIAAAMKAEQVTGAVLAPV